MSKNHEDQYQSLISIEAIDEIEATAALGKIGRLVDLSLFLSKPEGTEKAFTFLESLSRRELTPFQECALLYLSANNWSAKRSYSHRSRANSWEWDQLEAYKEILYSRLAIQHNGFHEIDNSSKCRILTNLANTLNNQGCYIEAIEIWNQALQYENEFGMALGNKGIGLYTYASQIYDEYHSALFLSKAKDLLSAAREKKLDPGAFEGFSEVLDKINYLLNSNYDFKDLKTPNSDLGRSVEEIQYRKWCSDNVLFLNPLNDILRDYTACYDPLLLPSIIVDAGEGPDLHSFFCQMKQEFVSARYEFFASINSEDSHFSDRGVKLFDTMDYPCFSRSAERLKSSYGRLYSLLDKIAYFVNEYFGLGVKESRVYFRTIWFSGGNSSEVRNEFSTKENLSLRALYWISKDLYTVDDDFREAIDHDFRDIWGVRRHLEHRYLKLHSENWKNKREKNSIPSTDKLAHSMLRIDFEKKTLRLLKLIRSALIYLSSAVKVEEESKSNNDNPGYVLPFSLSVLDDQNKI